MRGNPRYFRFHDSCGAFQFSLEGPSGAGTGAMAEIPVLVSQRGGLLRMSGIHIT